MPTTAADIVRLAQSPDGVNHMALTMRTQMTQCTIDGHNQRLDLTALQWNELRDLYSEILGRPITMNAVDTIMRLHPKAKIHLAGGSVSDTDVADAMLNALSQFVLGCDWPVFGDELGETRTDVFMATLRHQFNQLKF